MRFSLLVGIALPICLFLATCTQDELPEPVAPDCGSLAPTYTVDVEPIIVATCAYSGCHLDTGPGIFQNFEGLKPFLEDGSFRERVLSLRTDPQLGMPPDYAPRDRVHDLTEEQLLLLACWLEAGFPER